MKKNHNSIISFWKFIFSLLIVALHLGNKFPLTKYIFKGGSIGVDFFFIVSGYLFAKKCLSLPREKSSGKHAILFTLKKVQRFLPYIVFLWLISLPHTFLVEHYRFNEYLMAFYNLIYVPVSNTKVFEIYGITWYISAMLIIETLLYPLVVRFKKSFIAWVSPFIAFFSLNYLLIKYGHIAIPWTPSIISYGGFIRGLIGINIGMICNLICEKIKQVKFTKFSHIIMTIFEILGYLSIFIFVNKPDSHARFDVLMIIILSICIIISFSGKSLFNNILNNKLVYCLEKISLPIYLNQWLIIHMVEYTLHSLNLHYNYYYELFIVILISMLIAIIEEIIISFYHQNKSRLKRIFINPNC